MVNLNALNNKLDKIKKSIKDNGLKKIYIWIEENKPARLQFYYDNSYKSIYCDNIKDYEAIMKKYEDIEKVLFIDVDKPLIND